MERVAYSVDPFRFSIVLLKKTDLFGENALWSYKIYMPIRNLKHFL